MGRQEAVHGLLFAALILLVWGFFPQIKHFSVICSHFQYYYYLENVTFSWGDTECNCLFIQTSFTLTRAYLHHIHLRERKSSPLDNSTVWTGESFSQQLEVYSAVNPFFFFLSTSQLYYLQHLCWKHLHSLICKIPALPVLRALWIAHMKNKYRVMYQKFYSMLYFIK